MRNIVIFLIWILIGLYGCITKLKLPQEKEKPNELFIIYDNLNIGYYGGTIENLGDHKTAGPIRGGKYSLLEAVTRMPFFTCCNGTFQTTVSKALPCQVDLLSSLSALIHWLDKLNHKLESSEIKDNFIYANYDIAYKEGGVEAKSIPRINPDGKIELNRFLLPSGLVLN
jgi:hypothetical protein